MAAISAALLDRDPSFSISDVAATMVGGRRVVVTGAAGSIGTELVRQLSRLGADVVMLDIDESRLHALQLELSGSGLLDNDAVLLADIRDGRRLRRLFDDLGPEIVFHAAAHKHLPLLERYSSEAVKTNVVGTRNVVEAAVASGAERFVLISTDKAAEPTSVLGASKLLAERLAQSHAGRGMSVASVRFGNVLGSRGSLLDTLTWQLANGLPVTVTDPDVTRFFMSIPEAVSLVLDATSMAADGETYVLDMGLPIRIVDIVVRYAALLGEQLAGLQFCGLRPGEKLHEVLSAGDERQLQTAHPRISMIAARELSIDLARSVQMLEHAATEDDDELVRELLRVAVRRTDLTPDIDEPRTLTAVG